MSDIEPIVRIFCEKRGIDPDARVMVPCPDNMPGCLVAHWGPQWKCYEGLVRDGIAVIKALSDAHSAGDGNG